MAATIKGQTLVWSVGGLACSALVAGIEQSFERSISSNQKEILGDAGDCVTKVYSNTKADLSVELIPTASNGRQQNTLTGFTRKGIVTAFP